ncbi:hypothetical protein H2204_006109 [Knufia peltigerae]|uniref:AMP-dependent synthetase/ligase domain-containing protein n=1 Tax=Knufia peltigerae TaxID=1002370 RepID=A0AA38Y4U0_9EURO|nr:hypothetical protein H2204_006109 [Knufia peltigerae]
MAITEPNTKHPDVLWVHPHTEQTNMDKFRRWVNTKRKINLRNYEDLHAWSTSRVTAEDFWIDLFQFLQDFEMFPPPRFFPDVKANFTEHIFQSKTSWENVALHACSEGLSTIEDITWRQLHARVTILADAMRNSGLRKGDRVAAVITNTPEAIVTALAVLSIGAIWSTSSPDMGVSGILDRLRQIEPRFLLIETSVVYNGQRRPLMDKARRCLEELRKLPNFQKMIVIPRGRDAVNSTLLPGMVTWDDFNDLATGNKLVFEQLSFSHPGFIVYSSGTTGSPKCIVHSAMGALMKIKKDYMLHLDVRPRDTIYQYTTTGWIMWLMVLVGLSYGGKVVLYDGSPLQPDPLVTLRMVETLKITLFGTSARFLSDLKQSGIRPQDTIDLSSLRTVSSTGSVLQPDVCEWFHKIGFPPRVHLISSSGGTDLAGSLVNGDPTSPEYCGEIQRASLGMAIDILDSEKDQPVSIAKTGQPGELVCRMPFPSQPVMFWGEKGDKRYEDSYFSRYGRGIWQQGDFVSMSPLTGGFVMLGRSDGVLNPSGVRFGSAEIYNAIVNIHEFEETICVGQRRPQDSDETVLLFVKMKDDKPLTASLISRTKQIIQMKLTPRHVPKHILQVNEIPYTINGKKIELAVKQIVSGRTIVPSGAVANPESLKIYEKFVNIEEVTKAGGAVPAKL